MSMFLPLPYSTMASFILHASYSAIEILPRRDSAKRQLLRLYPQFLFTKIVNHYRGTSQGPLKLCLIDVDRLKLPRCPQDVIFEHIFKNALLHHCFFNIDYRQTCRYVGKHVEENIKNSFYISINYLRDVQRTCVKFPPGNAQIMFLRTS